MNEYNKHRQRMRKIKSANPYGINRSLKCTDEFVLRTQEEEEKDNKRRNSRRRRPEKKKKGSEDGDSVVTGASAEKQEPNQTTVFPPIEDPVRHDGRMIFLDKNVASFSSRHMDDHNEKFTPHKWKYQYDRHVRREVEPMGDRREQAIAQWYRTFAARRVSAALARKVRRNLALLPSVKTALGDLQRPPAPRPWDEAWGRNYLCEVCAEPAAAGVAACAHCNVVAHLACLGPAQQAAAQAAQRGRHASLFFDEDAASFDSVGGRGPEWVCAACEDEIRHAQEHYSSQKSRLYRTMVENRSAKVIQNFMTWARVRKQYLRDRMYIVMVQTVVRMHQRRKLFLKGQKAKKRPLLVRVVGCAGLRPHARGREAVNPQVILTVHEASKEDQVFRLETPILTGSNDPRFGAEAEFLLPSVTGNAMLAFTAVDEFAGHAHFLGQHCLLMRASPIARIGGRREARLGGPTALPRATSKRHRDVDLAGYHRACGTINYEIVPVPGARHFWGPMSGPPVDALLNKRAVTGTSAKAQNILYGKEVRWWVVLYNGEWLMYKQHQNDPVPKVRLLLKEMEFTVGDDLSLYCKMTKLEHEFMFFVQTKLDLVQWGSAIEHWTTVTKKQSKFFRQSSLNI